jgi:hypothetical protein
MKRFHPGREAPTARPLGEGSRAGNSWRDEITSKMGLQNSRGGSRTAPMLNSCRVKPFGWPFLTIQAASSPAIVLRCAKRLGVRWQQPPPFSQHTRIVRLYHNREKAMPTLAPARAPLSYWARSESGGYCHRTPRCFAHFHRRWRALGKACALWRQGIVLLPSALCLLLSACWTSAYCLLPTAPPGASLLAEYPSSFAF